MNIEVDFDALGAIADETKRLAEQRGVYLPDVHDKMTRDQLLLEMNQAGLNVDNKISQHGLVDRLRKHRAAIVCQLFGTTPAEWSPFMQEIHARMRNYFERKKFPLVEGLITQAVRATARNAHNWSQYRSEKFKSWEGRLRGLLRTLPDFRQLTTREPTGQSRPDFDANTVTAKEKSPEDIASDNELVATIEKKVGMTPDEFEVLRRCVLNRIPPRTVARELGKPIRDIYRLKAKAKDKLRAFMRTCWGPHADIRWMHVIEGMTDEEIAAREKISVEEVRRRLRDANEFPDQPFK
ncbi:MAG: hypothetical protein ACKO38_08200 [Planctomycetota bacterium]